MRASPGGVATSLATQALLSAGTGRHWMKSVPLLSSQDGPGRVQLEDFGPTRNRKVEGSNPSSGSKTPGQRVFLRMLTAQRQEAGHSFGSDITPPALWPTSLVVFGWDIQRCGWVSFVGHSGRNCGGRTIVEGGRLGRPCGPGAHSRAISEHQLALRRCSHISTTRMPSHAERSEPHVRTEVRAARASRVSWRVSSTLAGLRREAARPWQQAITWSITAA